MVYAIRKIAIPAKSRHKVVTTRSYKHFSASKFRQDLNGIDWESLKLLDDPNLIRTEWKSKFLSIICHAPFKMRRQRKNISPWINPTIKQLMIERDKIKSRAVKTNDAETWDKFRNFRNCVNNKIKNAKNAYCQ